MSTIMHHQLLCGLIEKAANAMISIGHVNAQDLAALEQKTVVIVLQELDFPLSFTFGDSTLLVTCLTERNQCLIETSLKTLKALQEEQQLTELIKQDKLNIVGDVKVAQQFANIFQQLDVDWQSELAKYIGDVPTHKLVQFSQWLNGKFQFAKQQITADASEWIIHEKKYLVTASELEHHYRQVKQVELSVEQLAQRIAKITNTIHEKR